MELDVIKKPYSKDEYNEQRLNELSRCLEEPLYFMTNFMKIQHPLRGAIPFLPYPFQLDLIKAFHTQRFTVALTARQMGKCLQSNSSILRNGKSIKIKYLIPQGFRERVITALEELLILAAKSRKR